MAFKYPNLAAEIARENISYEDVYKAAAVATGKSVDTVSNWMHGRAGELPTKAAFAIRDECFAGQSVDYLFSTVPITD